MRNDIESQIRAEAEKLRKEGSELPPEVGDPAAFLVRVFGETITELMKTTVPGAAPPLTTVFFTGFVSGFATRDSRHNHFTKEGIEEAAKFLLEQGEKHATAIIPDSPDPGDSTIEIGGDTYEEIHHKLIEVLIGAGLSRSDAKVIADRELAEIKQQAEEDGRLS